MSEKMRDGFEQWCLANGYTLIPAETKCGIIIDGDYGHPTVQIAWQAWQASRAALVVDLPEKAALMSSSSVYAALDNAGVGYK